METTPWLRDHVINNVVLLPGTGMLVMAIEAMAHMAQTDRPIAGFYIKDAVHQHHRHARWNSDRDSPSHAAFAKSIREGVNVVTN